MVKERMADLCPKCLTKDDVFASINYLLNLMNGVGKKDDIDHLGNRRIRSVGEQLQNQLRIGFTRMDKIIKERMTIQDGEKLTPGVSLFYYGSTIFWRTVTKASQGFKRSVP